MPKKKARAEKLDTTVSLAPLAFEDALRKLMQTGTYSDQEIEEAVERARKDQQDDA